MIAPLVVGLNCISFQTRGWSRASVLSFTSLQLMISVWPFLVCSAAGTRSQGQWCVRSGYPSHNLASCGRCCSFAARWVSPSYTTPYARCGHRSQQLPTSLSSYALARLKGSPHQTCFAARRPSPASPTGYTCTSCTHASNLVSSTGHLRSIAIRCRVVPSARKGQAMICLLGFYLPFQS